MNILQQLAAPFEPSQVSWRVGRVTRNKDKAMPLAYIDARDVMDRLDTVMHSDWQDEYVHMPNNTMCCRIGLFINDKWIWRANGAGASDIEGDKGIYSDAFKRAAVLWGVGRYLYDVKARWAPINEFKQFSPETLKSFEALLPTPSGVARLSPAQANKEINFTELVDGLKNCHSEDALSAYLEANQATLDKFPANWLGPWDDRVALARDSFHAREAA